MILLRKPWLTAMNPDINWARDTLQLPSTPRSLQLERAFEKLWRENSTPNPTPPPKPRKKFRLKKTQSNSLPFTLHFPKTGKEPLNNEKKKRKKNPFQLLFLTLTTNYPSMTPWKMSGMTLQYLPEK
jgi:hypothetical protein